MLQLLFFLVAEIFTYLYLPDVTNPLCYLAIGWIALTWTSRWGLYLNIAILVDIIGIIFAYPMVFFAKSSYGPVNNSSAFAVEPRLPNWLSAWMTPDNSLWGDSGWRTKHCKDAWDTKWGMAKWLLRNHGYGARWTFLAAPITGTIRYQGDPFVNRNTKAGTLVCTMGDYWQWKWVWPIPKTKYCLMFNFGWLLDDFIDGTSSQPKALFLASPRIATYKPLY
jgi:hypothetical protein